MSALGAFVRSRVARRMVVLFVLCALLPVVCLAVVAFIQVTAQLRAASERRLHQASKSVGMELIDQLRRLDAELALVESTPLAPGQNAQVPAPERFRVRLAQRFTSVAVVSDDGMSRVLIGSTPPSLDLTPPEVAQMRTGRSVLTLVPQSDGTPRIVLKRLLESWGPGHVLVAQVDSAFIWDRDLAPPQTQVHVLGPSREPLFTSFTPEVALPPDSLHAISGSATGDLEWEYEGETYLASYWSLPLTFDFLGSDWTIVVSESRADALAPLGSARVTFVLVTTLSLLVVLLLSLSQVRRSLVPLARLQDGTRRIGRGDFDNSVDVKSGDEFEELAGSFNTMSRQLKRQFDTLSAMGELDRAVLSSLDVDTIVHAVLDRLPRLLECTHLAVILLDPERAGHARAFVKTSHIDAPADVTSFVISPEDVRALLVNGHTLRVNREHGIPSYLSALEDTQWATCVVLPVVFADRLLGVLALADSETTDRSAEDLLHARQLADQVGVALSNADLVQALDRLNVGTLNALARTVDAKSPWTAGHSQRVTRVALEIGKEMGLAQEHLDTLARGGLLHDIGKIAVPSAILNKPGRLTEQEFAVMKEHPRTGARILEPIAEYQRLIPIVLQHHEWFDGGGYPDGIAGEAIDLGARILAVADVFDALTSERPYRAAMDLDVAVGVIRAESGAQFDPRIVEAFLRVFWSTAGKACLTSRPAEASLSAPRYGT